MELLSPAPQPGGLQPEYVHTVGADAPPGGELRPPHAVCVLALVQEHLPVQAPQLLRGVDVKEEKPAGHEEGVNPLKGPLQGLGPGDVVDAVQAADAGVDGAVEIQLLHGLVEEDGRNLPRAPALLRRHGQHLLRPVGPDHLIAPLRQFLRQAAGAAGQIQHGVDGQSAAGEVLLQIVRPAAVGHVGGELVVAPGQKLIRHLRPASP